VTARSCSPRRPAGTRLFTSSPWAAASDSDNRAIAGGNHDDDLSLVEIGHTAADDDDLRQKDLRGDHGLDDVVLEMHRERHGGPWRHAVKSPVIASQHGRRDLDACLIPCGRRLDRLDHEGGIDSRIALWEVVSIRRARGDVLRCLASQTLDRFSDSIGQAGAIRRDRKDDRAAGRVYRSCHASPLGGLVHSRWRSSRIAADDPEGEQIYHSLLEYQNDRIIILAKEDTALVNALQRRSAVVLQKSIREGFGLTVTEAMWKGTPVIGGNVGGIRYQIEDGKNGYLVDSIDEAADRIVRLVQDENLRRQLGKQAHQTVKDKFLLIRLLEQYIDLLGGFETYYNLKSMLEHSEVRR